MTDKLNVKDGDIVVPGEVITEGMSWLPTGKAVRRDKKIYATTLGLISVKGHVIKVIPLTGRYSPKRNDSVIGKITGINKYGWKVDIRSPFDTELNVADASHSYIDVNRAPLNKFFDVGEYVFAGITIITKTGYIKLITKDRPYRKLSGGIITEVSPAKIPRIIGKLGSMIKMLKDLSGCEVLVGQNGWVWAKGEPERVMKVIEAIKKIEKESHTKGLTDTIKQLLETKDTKEIKETKEPKEKEPEDKAKGKDVKEKESKETKEIKEVKNGA